MTHVLTAASDLPADVATLQIMVREEQARNERLTQIIKEMQRYRFVCRKIN